MSIEETKDYLSKSASYNMFVILEQTNRHKGKYYVARELTFEPIDRPTAWRVREELEESGERLELRLEQFGAETWAILKAVNGLAPYPMLAVVLPESEEE